MGRVKVVEKDPSPDVWLRNRVEPTKQAIMGLVMSAVATVASFLTSVMNFLTDPFLTPSLSASLQYLEDTELKTLQGEKRAFKAKSLWEKTGAVVMAVRRPG